MKKIKRLLTILCLVSIISILLIGCGKKVEMVRVSTSEEVLELFNKYNTENNIEEMVKLYSDEYIDYIGYDANKIINMIKNNRKDATINSLKKAVVNINAVINGEETNEDYVYALIKEEDGWSISPDGISECINFDVPANKEKELNLNLMKEAVLFDGALIRVDLYNDTSNSYIFGTKDDKTQIIVETTEGTFTSEVEEPQEISKRVKSYFIAKIQDLKGDIKKVTVTSIYELDKEGNVIVDSKRDIVAYNK